MLSRRRFFKATLSACGCALCGVGGVGTVPVARADEAGHIRGQGFALSFVGAQRETIMNGKLASAIDVKTLASKPHVYAIGPIEELRGEVTIINNRPALARVAQDGRVQVTESFETGAPFLVWAEVPAWHTIPIPPEVRSFGDLEAFVPYAAATAGHNPQQPLPFLVRGRADLIDFHVLNRIGNDPHNAEIHKRIQVGFELKQSDAVIVGFYSTVHRGIFIPMDSTIHMHFQTPDNKSSGHIQALEIGRDAMLSVPQRA